jgi:hypothetical protein
LKAASATPAFDTAFLQGKLEQAATLINQSNPDSASLHGLVYLEAARTGAKELAETHWQALLADLKKRSRDERFVGEVLSGAKPLEPRVIKRLPIDPLSKRVLLALLAQRFPQHAGELLPLARRLNFQRDAIALCLRKFLTAPAG